MAKRPRMLMEARCLTCNAQHSGEHDLRHPHAISQAQRWARGHAAEYASHHAVVDISYSYLGTTPATARQRARRPHDD